MPYTPQERRGTEDDLRAVVHPDWAKGDLTWAISTLMDEFAMTHDISYQNLSDARAAAQDAADEWYRRVMSLYEDKKAAENGDVYRVLGSVG